MTGKWIQAPPIQPGWYWYRDIRANIGPVVLYVDEMRLAYGRHCDGAAIEKMPGEWWSELLQPPVS